MLYKKETQRCCKLVCLKLSTTSVCKPSKVKRKRKLINSHSYYLFLLLTKYSFYLPPPHYSRIEMHLLACPVSTCLNISDIHRSKCCYNKPKIFNHLCLPILSVCVTAPPPPPPAYDEQQWVKHFDSRNSNCIAVSTSGLSTNSQFRTVLLLLANQIMQVAFKTF